ncbi:MAG: FAD-dependent oxidoreductase [Candidatus Saelkia tenebricola]|nr:FAD-dependent oxidoreductase [Candidatus Saelkia tenebricola]
MGDKIIKKPIVVVGAGLTGLVVAHELIKKGLSVIVIEKENQVGGLGRTLNYNGMKFDIGPHRFYSNNEEIVDYIYQILGSNLKEIKRSSLIYCQGRYFNWPLSFIDIFNLRFKTLFLILRDFVFNIKIVSIEPEVNYASYIKDRYGKTIYNIFFKNLSDKFLSCSADKIHWIWAKAGIEKAVIDERIYSRNLKDVALMLFRSKKFTKNYFYPINGVGMFADTLMSLIKDKGGVIKTSEEVIDIEIKDKQLTKVILKNEAILPSQVIWTAPLTILARILNYKELKLIYHPLQVFFLLFEEQDLLKKFQWCYYSDKNISFHRLSIPSCFSSNLAMPGKASIIIERSYDKSDEYSLSPLELKEKILNDLKEIRVVNKTAQIQDILIKRIDNAYPVYTLDFVEKKDDFLDYLKVFKNIKLAGRQGLFWYNNMDECIENALEVAEGINPLI